MRPAFGVILTRSQSPAPEVTGSEKDLCLVVGNLFNGIAPLSGQFACSFTSLDSGVHRQDFVISKQRSDVLLKLSK